MQPARSPGPRLRADDENAIALPNEVVAAHESLARLFFAVMTDESAPIEITPKEAAEMLRERRPKAEGGPLLLDCRTPGERAAASIAGSIFIPVSEIDARLDEIVGWRDRAIIVYCHAGARSLAVAAHLRRRGFPHARSLAGGIDRWSIEVDSSVPRY